MFVITENHGIINLSCFPQVDVIEHDGVWLLQAFYQKPLNAPTFFLSGFPLAEFKEEIEARYSFCRLYSALEAGESVWDPRTVGWFSDLWGKAKKELSSSGNPHIDLDILEQLELEITGLREITISYDSADIYENERRGIESKIQYTFAAADPVQNSLARWKIDWIDIKDGSLKTLLHLSTQILTVEN